MALKSPGRRTFVKGSASALALSSFPYLAIGQTVRPRLEWADFVLTRDYASLRQALISMKANRTASSRNSWQYWINSHVSYCPHGIAYFLAWHRGYLYYLEQTIRTISGNSTFMLPYWDYYAHTTMPDAFLDSTSGNPFYNANRVNSNVSGALTFAPFAPAVNTFNRGTSNAFETAVESAPHNPVHNIIGGVMATMQSPTDPIFFLHHCNIDRLWAAWVAAGAGRQMPSSTSSYWSSRFTYGSSLTLNRIQTINTSGLGYVYNDLALPAQPVQTFSALARVASPGAARPPAGRFTEIAPVSGSAKTKSLGGAGNVALNESSVTAEIHLDASATDSLQSVLAGTSASPFSGGKKSPYVSVQIVLDGIKTTELGQQGGYFYHLYLNLPVDSSGDSQYLLGNVGPFQITGAEHHPGSAQLVYPATQLLKGLSPDQLNEIAVSFVRVSGENASEGRTMTIAQVRVEVSTEEVQ